MASPRGLFLALGIIEMIMDSLRPIALRLSAGLVAFALLAVAIELPNHYAAVPFWVYVVLGVQFSMAFFLFGRPIIFGFSLRPRVFPSYFVSVAIVLVVIYILFFIRSFPVA